MIGAKQVLAAIRSMESDAARTQNRRVAHALIPVTRIQGPVDPHGIV